MLIVKELGDSYNFFFVYTIQYGICVGYLHIVH